MSILSSARTTSHTSAKPFSLRYGIAASAWSLPITWVTSLPPVLLLCFVIILSLQGPWYGNKPDVFPLRLLRDSLPLRRTAWRVSIATVPCSCPAWRCPRWHLSRVTRQSPHPRALRSCCACAAVAVCPHRARLSR